MKVVVDSERCEGHGQCTLMAPELFELDEDGRAVVLGDRLSESQVSLAEVAEASCPEQAIALFAQ